MATKRKKIVVVQPSKKELSEAAINLQLGDPDAGRIMAEAAIAKRQKGRRRSKH
jgi:hypothetical protein